MNSKKVISKKINKLVNNGCKMNIFGLVFIDIVTLKYMRNRKDYPENWNDEIRPAILKRDNYKCCHCRIKHRSYVLVDSMTNRTVIDKREHDEYKGYGANTYRVFLQVAHIDNDKRNCSYENLISLCPTCHNAMDRQWKLVIRLAAKKKGMMEIS